MTQKDPPRNGLKTIDRPRGTPARSAAFDESFERVSCRDEPDEAEAAGGRVLRCVPERARQAVDREPLEDPGGQRVDVEAPKGCEWQVVASQTDEGEKAFGAGRQHGQKDCDQNRACPGNHTPAVEINGGNEQQPGAERVEQQAGLERMRGPYTSGDHRRRHEVRPVVIERSALQIRVANRRVRLRELGGQGHVPKEVGREIGAVSQVARRIPLSDPRERPCNEQRYDEEGA